MNETQQIHAKAVDHAAGLLTGPELDSVVAEATDWYKAERKFLIDALLAGAYPYGTVPLTEAEQVQNYDNMTPEGFAALRNTIMQIYKGDADIQDKTQRTLDAYDAHMQRLKRIQSQSLPLASAPGEGV